MKSATYWIIVGIIFVIGIIYSFYNSNENINNLSLDNSLNVTVPPLEKVKLLDSYSNIQEVHWSHMPLTYKIQDTCIEREVNLTKQAFEDIDSETNGLIKFKEVSTNEDISIYCKSMQYNKNSDMRLGDEIFNITPEVMNIIYHSEINIYGQGQVCGSGFPELEIHEILHGFGFLDDPVLNRVMSSYTSGTEECKIKSIDKPIISCLKNIYSNGVINGTCPKMLTAEDIYGDCEEGYYRVKGTLSCCPEPNMTIVNGYCY
jgi:hypothetical protein